MTNWLARFKNNVYPKNIDYYLGLFIVVASRFSVNTILYGGYRSVYLWPTVISKELD